MLQKTLILSWIEKISNEIVLSRIGIKGPTLKQHITNLKMGYFGHKTPPVTRETWSESKNRGQERKKKISKEVGSGHTRMAKHNNNTGSKIGWEVFAVLKEGSRSKVLLRD